MVMRRWDSKLRQWRTKLVPTAIRSKVGAPRRRRGAEVLLLRKG